MHRWSGALQQDGSAAPAPGRASNEIGAWPMWFAVGELRASFSQLLPWLICCRQIRYLIPQRAHVFEGATGGGVVAGAVGHEVDRLT
jgi:hypothetical protein